MVAAGPGAVPAARAATGWAVASVRFEPLGPGPGGLTVAGSGSYRGAIELRRSGGSVAVINDLAFEDYVRGIDEVPPSWPAAALEAQAIAARTYAAHRAVTPEATPWRAVGADICATPSCQVYRGLDAERRSLGRGWLPAVEATSGRVLLSGNQPILASYSATANGPVAMSQVGALAMAQEGRSASDILAAYYGIRPTFAPERVPAAIRVALTTGTPSVRISAGEAFRVVGPGGNAVATAAAGEWKVVPEGAGVRVTPPDGYGTGGRAVDAAPGAADQPAADPPRPSRALTAGAVTPGRGPWALAAVALLLGSGALGITLSRRRHA